MTREKIGRKGGVEMRREGERGEDKGKNKRGGSRDEIIGE